MLEDWSNETACKWLTTPAVKIGALKVTVLLTGVGSEIKRRGNSGVHRYSVRQKARGRARDGGTDLKFWRCVYWSSLFSSSQRMRLSRRPNLGMASIWALLAGVWEEERTMSSRPSRPAPPSLRNNRRRTNQVLEENQADNQLSEHSHAHGLPQTCRRTRGHLHCAHLHCLQNAVCIPAVARLKYKRLITVNYKEWNVTLGIQ